MPKDKPNRQSWRARRSDCRSGAGWHVNGRRGLAIVGNSDGAATTCFHWRKTHEIVLHVPDWWRFWRGVWVVKLAGHHQVLRAQSSQSLAELGDVSKAARAD